MLRVLVFLVLFDGVEACQGEARGRAEALRVGRRGGRLEVGGRAVEGHEYKKGGLRLTELFQITWGDSGRRDSKGGVFTRQAVSRVRRDACCRCAAKKDAQIRLFC